MVVQCNQRLLYKTKAWQEQIRYKVSTWSWVYSPVRKHSRLIGQQSINQTLL